MFNLPCADILSLCIKLQHLCRSFGRGSVIQHKLNDGGRLKQEEQQQSKEMIT